MSQLKEQNGRYYQEAEVVMLATKENPTPISIGNKSNIMDFHQFLFGKKEGIYNNHTFQHLYILSDDDTKEGDWCIDKYNQIWQFLDNCLIGFDADKNKRFRTDNVEGHKVKKIIATTDESLEIRFENHNDFDSIFKLPRPSDSFIRKFIEEYNKGNQITKVLVEYINNSEKGDSYNRGNDNLELKIDSNNCITIKRIQPKLYTKEEVKSILEKYASKYSILDTNINRKLFEEFLKENL